MLPIISSQKTVLGLSAQQVTDLTNLCNAYTTQFNVATSARLNAKSQDESKDLMKKNALISLLGYVKIWRANNAIPDSLLEQLMVAPHKVSGTKTPPVTPGDPQLSSNAQGVVKIKWAKNGNKSGTLYMVQTRTSTSAEWSQVAVTTETKFELNWTPGDYLGVRLIAQRNKQQSQPTAEIALWIAGSNPGEPALKIAA